MGEDAIGYELKSYIKIGEVFLDSHDHQWQKLLLQNEYKDVVVNSLRIVK